MAILFKDAEELLAEFKLFLPDTSQQGTGVDGSSQAATAFTNTSWQAYGGPTEQDFLGSKKRVEAPTGQKRKRRPADKDVTTTRGTTGRVRSPLDLVHLSNHHLVLIM